MKSKSPTIKVVSRNQTGFREKILTKLLAYNTGKVGATGWKSLNLEARDEKGKFLGGLIGSTYLKWFYVDLLFVEEKTRGRGVGKQLLAEAEAWAKKRNCQNVNLNTITFQAPGFYRKLGYKVFGRLPYPKGHVRYFFKKKL